MSGTKRPGASAEATKAVKKQKLQSATASRPTKTESFGSSDAASDEFSGVSEGEPVERPRQTKPKIEEANGNTHHNLVPKPVNGSSGAKPFKIETSSAEAHAKQRIQAAERKAAKPNAEAIARSKKIWERLRRKSHVPIDERKQLVSELFGIITGRVRDFVFKHDSVRVIQCALKYANVQQKQQIATELKGDIRQLVESRYGKFLVAKMVQDRDEVVRDVVVPAFYGHVRQLINHSEASWIVDDIYRQVATPKQKEKLLREWYGAEFALFHRKGGAPPNNAAVSQAEESADLAKILEASPEKRRPILQYLLQMINGLIQKKMTGFTMLHDAMLQYFINLPADSAEQTEFLEVLKGDIDADTEGGGGDLFRNLAFTRSGSRLVCLALAYGSAKDRKMILRCFRDTVEMMALDQFGKHVLLTALEVTDDTKLTSKAIVGELLGLGIADETQRLDRLEGMINSLHARLLLLYPFAGDAKWLVNDIDKHLLQEIHALRTKTSKKDATIRRQELIASMSAPLLELIAKRAENLMKTTYGCQAMTEILLEAQNASKADAMAAVAHAVSGSPLEEGHIASVAAPARMLKTLVLGGNFDPKTRSVDVVEPPLRFGQILYPVIEDVLVQWACSEASFVIVGFLESEDVDDGTKAAVHAKLVAGRSKIEKAATAETTSAVGDKAEKNKSKGNPGAKMLLSKLS